MSFNNWVLRVVATLLSYFLLYEYLQSTVYNQTSILVYKEESYKLLILE